MLAKKWNGIEQLERKELFASLLGDASDIGDKPGVFVPDYNMDLFG